MRKSLYMNILVPIDGSKYSEKALLHACYMARNYHSKLIILYVVDKSFPINMLDRKEYLGILRKFGNKVLNDGKRVTTRLGVDSKTVIKEGNVANEIVTFAKTEQCNLIIVGNRGLGAITRFFLGSISNKLANDLLVLF